MLLRMKYFLFIETMRRVKEPSNIVRRERWHCLCDFEGESDVSMFTTPVNNHSYRVSQTGDLRRSYWEESKAM